MAGGALSLPKEKLPPGRSIAGHAGFGGHRVERGDHRRQRIERRCWKIEGRHPCRGNSISDDIAQALSGAAAIRRISGKSRTLLCATRIDSMASAAKRRVRLLDIRGRL